MGKKRYPEFHVTMGSYDGAYLCKLVGLYLIDLLCKEFGIVESHLRIGDMKHSVTVLCCC